MRIIISLVMLSVSLNGYAQNYEISMSNVRQPVSYKQYNITSLMDGRDDKTTIGFVQKGMGNRKVNAVFESGLESEIYSYVKRSLPFSKENLPLVIRVNYLKISELTKATSEHAHAKIGIDFLTEREGELLLVLQTMGEARSKGMDVTRHHTDNIAMAIKNCFEQIDELDLENIDVKSLAQNDSVITVQEFDISLYSGLQQKPKRGIYKTYDEFLNNEPSILDFDLEVLPRTTKGWEGTFSPILKYPGSRKKIKDAWGFSDGISRHIFHQVEYFKIEITDEGVLFEAYDEMDFSSTTGAGVMAGAIGAGIASAAVVSKAKKNKTTYRIILAQGGTIKKQVDF